MKLSVKEMKAFINRDFSGNQVTHLRLEEGNTAEGSFILDKVAVIRCKIGMEVSSYTIIGGIFHSGYGQVSNNIIEAIEKYIAKVRG